MTDDQAAFNTALEHLVTLATTIFVHAEQLPNPGDKTVEDQLLTEMPSATQHELFDQPNDFAALWAAA